jgi:hypothetical protein
VPKKERKEGEIFTCGPMMSASAILLQPTAMTNELKKPEVKMVEKLYKEGEKYKKPAVMLSGLAADNSPQGNLFEPGKNIGRFLMEIMDNINFGM